MAKAAIKTVKVAEIKAAEDFIYGKDFYRQGDVIPASLVPELEKYQCHVLETHVSVNGTWYRIDDPLIKGWVEMRKPYEQRLMNYFKLEPEKPKEIPLSVNPLILKARKTKLTKEEFISLIRHEQGRILTRKAIKFSYKDKEKDLLDKYMKA